MVFLHVQTVLQPLFWILGAVEIERHLAVRSSGVAFGAGVALGAVAVAQSSGPPFGTDVVLPPVGSTPF